MEPLDWLKKIRNVWMPSKRVWVSPWQDTTRRTLSKKLEFHSMSLDPLVFSFEGSFFLQGLSLCTWLCSVYKFGLLFRHVPKIKSAILSSNNYRGYGDR